jgi:hypothetical protein
LKVRLNINCDNVTFAGDRLHESARMLRNVADRLDYNTSPPTSSPGRRNGC